MWETENMSNIEEFKPQASAPINWDAELRGAQMLVKSNLVPKDIKTAESALFVILAGRDMGLSPVQSLRGIKPIQGKLELSADLQLGLYHRSGGKSQWVVLTDKEATLKLQAPWSIEPHLSTFTVEDAKRAQLMSNPTWLKYPKAMLRSRAITQGLKDIGFLLGAGVYAPGEIGGGMLVDEATGEVLPAEVDVTPVTGMSHTSTDSSVETLDDGERTRVENVALEIANLIANGAEAGAYTKWQEQDTDAKVAIWALLDKSVRKIIKEISKQPQGGSDAETTRQNETEVNNKAGAPSLRDALAALKRKDFDTAADIARSLVPDEAKAVEAEIATMREAG
jgi:hypothetical protein